MFILIKAILYIFAFCIVSFFAVSKHFWHWSGGFSFVVKSSTWYKKIRILMSQSLAKQLKWKIVIISFELELGILMGG